MRNKYLLGGLVFLGLLGVIGWSALGRAQPATSPAKSSVTKKIIERVPPRFEDEDLPPLTPQPRKNPPLAKNKPTPSPAIVDPADVPQEPTRLIPQPIRLPDVLPKKDSPAVKIDIPDPARPTTVIAPEPLPRIDSASSATQPTVSVEWSGPNAVKVGQTAEFSLLVRNISTIPIQKVIVQARVPSGMEVVSVEPKAEANQGVLLWELGNLLAKQERRLQIKVTSPQRGDMAWQAWVTFTGSSVMKVQVREPKLAVKIQAPDKVVVGEPVNVLLMISNPGDHPADHVKLAATLGEGLETIRGNKLAYDLGALAAGDTRTLTIPCITKTPGQQICEVVVDGDGGLHAADRLALNVIQPRLDLAIVGPKLRYLDRKAVYTLKVTNPGDAPASNVFVTELVPAGFKFVQADSGGQHDEETRSIKWFVGELGAGQSREVKFELLAVEQGEFTHKAAAHASRGMKSEQELKTAIEGLSAILMELVDTEDPVEVSGETAYEIKVTNTGSKAETDVKLVCTIPPQMKVKSVNAPLKYELVGNELTFQPLPRLSPRADVVFRITVTAEVKGDARFKASLTTASLVEPVIKVEPTKVYAD